MPTPTWEETTPLATTTSPSDVPTWDNTTPVEPEFSPSLPLSSFSPPESRFAPADMGGVMTSSVLGPPPVFKTPQTIPEGIFNVGSQAAASMLSPVGLGLGAIAPIQSLRPILAGVIGGLGAKQIGQAAGTLAGSQNLTPGQTTEQVGNISLGALQALAPIAHVLTEHAPVLPRATQAATQAIIEKGIQDASRIQKAAEVHGDLQPSPGTSEGQVPAEESSKGVQPQAEEARPEERPVLLNQPGLSEPEIIAMGGDIYGNVPEPRQATAAGASVENAKPPDKPLGPKSSLGQALSNAWAGIKGAFGATMPKTTARDRATGELGARYLASRIAAKPLADTFAARVLQDTGVDPVKFGAALTEDNLRSIREGLKSQATDLRTKGKQDEADAVEAKANNVATIIGSKGSPFKTEDEYFDYLNELSVKKAIGQHIQLWQEVIDPQFKAAMDIDPDVELPSRGLQTGARVNLKAVLSDEQATSPVKGVGGASLTATFKKKSPFGIKAKGTGDTYDINYQNLIRNTYERQLEIANKNKFDDAMVKSGNAVLDAPGRQIKLGDGESTVAFPISRKVVVAKGEGGTQTFSQAKNIYVRKSLSDEYRSAANVDHRFRIPVVTGVMNLLNRAALAGLTDATTHVFNQMTTLFNRPLSGKLFSDTLISATGRADVPVTFVKAVIKAFQNNKEQLSQLAEINALRPDDIHYGLFSRALRKTDEVTRLILDDTFKSLVEQGLVENTETARREYVNQIGNYNRRAQGWLTRFFRDTGFGPFVTAGKTFNALGVRMSSMDPGAKASNTFAAAALRANVLSKWIGASVLIGTLNYLLTHKKGGGMLGRKGTPFGNVDLGTNDKSGKQQSLPLASILGVGRGLRVTGAKAAIDAKRMGLSDADALEGASRDIINSWTAPFAGPPIKTAMIAASGYPPAVNVGRAAPVVPPGNSQRLENVKEAVREVSPLVQSYVKYKQGKPLSDIASTQIPRLAPYAGKTEALAKDYPRIVKAAQASEFIDWVVHETRRKPQNEKIAFANEQTKRLPPEFQKRLWNELKHRRVFAP